MKRAIILILLILLVIFCFGCSATTPQISVKTYTNEALGFTVNYPEGWQVSESSEDTEEGNVFLQADFFKEDTVGLSIVAILIFEPTLPRDTFQVSESLEDFYYYYVTEPVMIIYEEIEGFEVLEEKDTTIDELPAKEITFKYNYSTSDPVWKHTIIAFLDTHITPFKVSWNEPEDVYDEYYPYLRLIVDSFKFTGE